MTSALTGGKEKSVSSEQAAASHSVEGRTVPFAELPYGFQYGAAKVTRLFSDEKKGCITLGIETPKQAIQVYVTKTGKIRINDSDGEWFRLSKC